MPEGRLEPYTAVALPEWLDYNGHMSEPYYVMVFGFATTYVMDQLGMDEQYRSQGLSLYTVEAHVQYLDEVTEGSSLTVTSQVIGSSGKKLHLAHELHVGDSVVATEEIMGIHVDQQAGRAVDFGDELTRVVEQHRCEPPKWTGRRLGLQGEQSW